MKQSTIVLLFGMVYAIIALSLKGESTGISLFYVVLSGLTAILYVSLDSEETRKKDIYCV